MRSSSPGPPPDPTTGTPAPDTLPTRARIPPFAFPAASPHRSPRGSSSTDFPTSAAWRPRRPQRVQRRIRIERHQRKLRRNVQLTAHVQSPYRIVHALIPFQRRKPPRRRRLHAQKHPDQPEIFQLPQHSLIRIPRPALNQQRDVLHPAPLLQPRDPLVIPRLRRHQEVVIMKNELPRSPLPIKRRHLIRDPFHFPLPKPLPRRQPVKRRDAALRAVPIAPATPHPIAGRHPRYHMHRPPTVRRSA